MLGKLAFLRQNRKFRGVASYGGRGAGDQARRTLKVGVALLVMATNAVAQTERKPDSKPKPAEPRKNSPSQEEKPPIDQPTAEDLLRSLQRERPINEIIPPSSAKGGEWPKTKKKLLPEGTTLIDRTGSVERDGDEWRFRFDDTTTDPTYRLLPNAVLEVLVNATEGGAGTMRFVISGEVTTYAEENRLLLRSVRRAPRLAEAPPPKSTAPLPLAPDPPAEADPASVVRVLTEREPTRAALSAPANRALEPGPRRGPGRPSLIADGTPLIDRPGRVLRDGSWWTFVPESDRPDRIEAALRLLPNRSTETIAKAPNASTGELVFIVSGEITQFQGENYLLPRAALRNLSSDNLRK